MPPTYTHTNLNVVKRKWFVRCFGGRRSPIRRHLLSGVVFCLRWVSRVGQNEPDHENENEKLNINWRFQPAEARALPKHPPRARPQQGGRLGTFSRKSST
jgi:hypothetical protein